MAMEINDQALTSFIFRTNSAGQFILDVYLDGEFFTTIGVFETEEERKSFMLRVMAELRKFGAQEIPHWIQ